MSAANRAGTRTGDHTFPKVPFTPDMKKTHTILVPQMLPIHFELIAGVLRQDGYNVEILKTDHKGIAEEGLRSVHNDTCYPALLVIGQFMDALKSGSYDLDKVALLISQTGGGCRASNYIFLLRKALHKNGYGHIPVISLNFSGLEKNSGFSLSARALVKMVAGLLYGDFMMSLYNQCIPYEQNKGDADRVVDKWTNALLAQMHGPGFVRLKSNYKRILADFLAIELDNSREKIKVGIVGEIYLKYAPLGNNNLERYLVSEGAEVVNSGLLDFIMYCIYNTLHDHELYGGKKGVKRAAFRFAMWYTMRKQREMISVIKENGTFSPPADFARVIEMSEGYLDHGVKMGEGWLLTADMLELIHSGVQGIVTAQPFGCLPNHIVAKGMIRKIKQSFPSANIVAVDYDPGASRINQENRLRLMLANAKMLKGVTTLEYTEEPDEAVPSAAASPRREMAEAVG